MALDKQTIAEALRQVVPSGTDRDVVSRGMVKNIAECDGLVRVSVMIDPAARDGAEALRVDLDAAVRQIGEAVKQVNIELIEVDELPGGHAAQAADAPAQPRQQADQQPDNDSSPQPSMQAQAREQNPLPDVRHVIAVGAGKGGVGKSTIAVNLAVGLARLGHKVGLLDGDIYGPSTPTLLGLDDVQITGTSQTLHPMFVHGIKTMTIGKLVDPQKALIWRGPMAHGAFRQLALQTDWGELDYLIVDLPPGTGDVPLTLGQLLPLTGAVIVCTPQKVAQDDAIRACGMFEQMEVPVIGVVENMSYFIGDDGKEYDIFGRGGAAAMAERLGLPMLGTIPINTALRANGDAGDPRKNFEGGDALAQELETMCREFHQTVEQRGDERPTLSIS